ncbi:hypothetical protein A6R68_05539, partial [Neotoma lepida]
SIDWGWVQAISHQLLVRRHFLKDDTLIIFVDFEDLTHLIRTEVPTPANSVTSRGLLLQDEEPPVLAESSWRKP